MIDLVHSSGVEATSSNGFRNAILARHDVLRGLLAETVQIAERRPPPTAKARRDRDALRSRARYLYLTLDANLAFEASAFPAALRDLIGWAAVLQEQIEEAHARQRLALATALSALEPEDLSFAELADDVRAIAAAVLSDLEQEEAALLKADLDAIATDSEGG